MRFIHHRLLPCVKHVRPRNIGCKTYNNLEKYKKYDTVRVFVNHNGGQIDLKMFVDDCLPEYNHYKSLNEFKSKIATRYKL